MAISPTEDTCTGKAIYALDRKTTCADAGVASAAYTCGGGSSAKSGERSGVRFRQRLRRFDVL